MSKKFSELRSRMSPEWQENAQARKIEMCISDLLAMPAEGAEIDLRIETSKDLIKAANLD
ncbi:hypothetical protein BCM14_1531 [Jezberella montanilacus]|uniref:Uncharacterized protein n=1 Tax=Jezberella montanilacus TaxID=323426 RepID=A0A2T0XIG8_9BURK|nr:hypothetical protein BCM14_1531 [Jezberella montanilacus]